MPSAKRNSRTAPRFIWILTVIAVALLAWPVADLIYVSTGNVTDSAVASDVIIVLGCPSYENNVVSTTFSACVQARAHHAAHLYNQGLASHIIPTGGLTGPPPTEAAAMSTLLRADGVPTSAITLEGQALNTVQNIQYSRTIMRANNWRTAILVTEPNHIKRAALVAHDAGLTITLSPVTESPGWNTPDARYHNLWNDAHTLMSYQLSRLFGGLP